MIILGSLALPTLLIDFLHMMMNDVVRFMLFFFFFFQAEDGIRDVERSRGLGDGIRDRTTGYLIQSPKVFHTSPNLR